MKLHFLIPLLSIALIDDAGKTYGNLKVEGIDLNFDPEEALKNLPDACNPFNINADIDTSETYGNDFEFFTEDENAKLDEIFDALVEAPDRTAFFNASLHLHLHNYIGTLHAKYHCDDCKSTTDEADPEAAARAKSEELFPGVPAFTSVDDLITFLEKNPEKSGAFALKLDKGPNGRDFKSFDKIIRDIADTIRNPPHGVPAPSTK